MSCRLIIRPEAESDIIDAVVWYENREVGLGLRVSADIRAAIEQALEHPKAHLLLQIPRSSSHSLPTISLSRLLRSSI